MTHLGSHFRGAVLRAAWKARTVESAVANYCAKIGLGEETAEALSVALRAQTNPLDSLKVLFDDHASRRPAVYTFSFADFEGAYQDGVDSGALSRGLDIWSYRFGELANQKAEHFILDNPIWRRPYINLENGAYFCPVVGTALSFCLEMMSEFVERVLGADSGYFLRRSKYLQQSAESIFKSGLPSATVHSTVTWRDKQSDIEYENDLVVVCDNCLFVVEAKSGQINDQARRGAAKSLGTAVDRLIVGPAQQAGRLIDYVNLSSEPFELRDGQGGIFSIDPSTIGLRTALSVLLEPSPLLNISWLDLQDAGFISLDVTAAPKVLLTDLETVFHVLDDEVQRLHYLMKRSILERSIRYFGDEVDLLAYYLSNGLIVSPVDDGKPVQLTFNRIGRVVDEYMEQFEEDIPPRPRPGRKLTKLWLSMTYKAALEQSPGWSENCFILLSTALDDQIRFEQDLIRAKVQVARDRSPHTVNDVVLEVDTGIYQALVMGLVFKNLSRERLLDRAWALCGESARSSPGPCLVFGFDMQTRKKPYSWDARLLIA